jgi:hypothetical protein
MYAEPLVIYRELVQNAADSIEAAISAGVLKPAEGMVQVEFDPSTRTVGLVDNGLGLSNEMFEAQMLSFGASIKRSEHFRGFRGIGRLAGLGHCKELVFRSRSHGDSFVREARWSSLRARELIGQAKIVPLETLAQEIVTLNEFRPTTEPESFFEVRLEGVRRVSDDRLFDRRRINAYLSDVAPVSFSPSFSRGEEIRASLLRRGSLLELQMLVGGEQVFKPYRDEIEVRAGRTARIGEVEYIELPAIDEQTAAYGWVAHHDYLGALRSDSPGRGLRVRSGNLQIGDWGLLAKAFPEERFNAWAIGELHVFDGRLRANARRDAFEPSAHVDNLYNQLAPYAAAIAKRCRQQSKSRNEARRSQSLSSVLEAVDQALGNDRSAYAVAVRRLVGQKVQEQIELLAQANVSMLPDFEAVRLRASSLAKRHTAKKLTPRQKGQLEVLDWLYSKGQLTLLTEAVSEFRRVK